MFEQQFTTVVLLIKQSRNNALKSINTELINLYWNVGAYISKQISSSTWGEKTVYELAEFIKNNHPELKGFNRRGLYRMKQFYEIYTAMSFVSSPMAQLEISDIRTSILTRISWTHHLTLLSRTRSKEEREFYLRLCIKEKYSVKELERQINSGVFEKTMLSDLKLSPSMREFHHDIASTFKDSYIFDFLNLTEPYSESDLQQGLIKRMKNFVLELGKDFLYVGEQYKIQVGNSDFYIDLLFYHRGLQCLVAFELKADKFKPEHLGQLNFYLEALDRDLKKQNENPSIGILLCKDKDIEVVEYALSRSLSPTMVAEYKTQLPDKGMLQQKLHELFKEN